MADTTRCYVGMKNFPHQVSNLDKLTGALKVADNLLKAGADVGSDGTYGAALARAGVYAFRQAGTVDQLLAQEARKPAANRGTFTAARELRRFLVMSGFLEAGNLGGDLRVTANGRELLASKGAVRDDLWRSAMLGLAVTDAQGRTSHPYRILLRLAADQPGIETAKLMLAFEAVDDTEEEYVRILDLSGLSLRQILDATGVRPASAANAVKILPSIAEQVGDLERMNQRAFPRLRFEITEDVFTQAAQAEPVPTSSPTAPVAFTEVAVGAMGTDPNFSPTEQTNVDLSEAIALRKARTKEHQEAVRSLAKLLNERGFALSQHPFDCLALKARSTLLVEVKTLDGSPADERRQCERAVGQLAGYSHFDMPADVREFPSTKLAGFSRPPSKAALSFLASCGIRPIWLDSHGDWQTLAENGDLILFEP